jgi:ATP-dependent Clp protease ATP-binding subunit ClpA
MTHKKTVKNLQKLTQNPIINKVGLLAFLEILHKLLKSMNLDINKTKIMQIQHFEDIDNFDQLINAVENEVKDRGESNDNNISTTKSTQKDSKKMTVEYFGTDLTKEYQEGFIDPIIGREKEIDQVIYTLLRKTKNNPLLIGEPGVGKTAIVEGLAQRIAL